MAKAIRLTVVTGPHQNQRFCFCGPSRCQAGRALDCFIHLGGTERDLLISRYHCQMEFDPPHVQILDLGSRNGTFINGQRLDPLPQQISDLVDPAKPGVPVAHGDLITLGGTSIKVEVVDCPYAGKEGEVSGWDGEPVKKDCQLPCES